MDHSTNPRVTPYARISDTDEERAPGIDRQLRIILPIIGLRGATALPERIDNNKSAFDPDVYRDDFEQWLKDFEANLTDGIIAYDLDRIFRQLTDLERVIRAYCAAAKRGRPTILWLQSGSLDLTTTDGQFMARVLVSSANKSSGDTARRTTDRYRDEALLGRTYSNYPAFGWDRNGKLNAHAELRRQAILDVALGITPTAIAERWRKAGVPTVRGKVWKSSAVRRVILAPRNAGFVVYLGEILIGEDEKPIKGDWEPLIDEEPWREACAVILGKEKPAGRRTKSLLSTIARCGRCGAGMVRIKRNNGRYSYACRSRDSGGCASVAINGNRLDEQIIGLAKAYLAGRRVQAKPEPFQGQARLDEVAGKIAELMAEYNAGNLSGSIVFPSIKKLEDEQRALQSAKAKHIGEIRRAMALEDAWPDDVEKQKAVLRQLFVGFVIQPSGRTGGYNPDRVEVIWRQD